MLPCRQQWTLGGEGRSDAKRPTLSAQSDRRPGGTLPVISLFSGAGCLDLAIERCADPPLVRSPRQGPLRVAAASDYDEPALATFRANFPTVPAIHGDIREIPTEQLLEVGGLRPGDPVLVVGGPPCTPFSKSGFWLEEKRTSRDPNASLLDEFARVVREARPEAFILENVQGLTYGTHRAQFRRLLDQLGGAGYTVSWKVLMAADYGVPQLRRRVFVLGRRGSHSLDHPVPTHSGWSERDRRVDHTKLPYVTARDAIGDLLPGVPEPNEVAEGRYADLLADVPPGHNYLWHTERHSDTPAFRWRSRYWTFLLRLDPERPSTTLQAQPGPWVGPFHWRNVENAAGRPRARRLRVPELLRLMSLPDDFVTVGDRATVQRQLGNAVPLELGKAVVRSVMEQLGYLEVAGEPLDQRQLDLLEAVS